MSEPLPEIAAWIDVKTTLAIHERQLQEHGGLTGVRDAGLLESALMRPQHMASYAMPDLVTLAAAYAYGIAKNHPFSDGNKRTAYIVCRLFLQLNGYDFEATQEDKYTTFYNLAAGTLSEEELAAWLAKHLVKKPA